MALFLAIKYYKYAIENPTHLASAALLDSINLSATARHTWYGSFSKSLMMYGIPLPVGTEAIQSSLVDAKKRMEHTLLGDIKLRISEMSRLSMHHTIPATWKRKP